MGKFMVAAALSAAFLVASLAISPAVAANEPSATAKRELTPGQIAARERQKKCAAEWHDAKAQGKIPQGVTWPKFWSDCNARLKAQGQ
jgi:uncharacterized membrane protein